MRSIFIGAVMVVGLSSSAATAATDPDVTVSKAASFDVHVDESFSITFTMKNIGDASATDIGYLDISIPDYLMLAEPPLLVNLGFDDLESFHVGETIWDGLGN